MSAPHEFTMLALTFERHSPDFCPEKVPPHLSIMPWFDARPFSVEPETAKIREAAGLVTLELREEKIYGVPGHEKPGRRVEGDGLKWLHISLYQTLVQLGVKFSHPQWLGKNYEPHYTFPNGRDPLEGETQLQFDELAVITNIRNGRSDRFVKQVRYLGLGE